MSPQEGVPAAGGVGVVGGVAGVPAAEVAGAAAPLQLDAQLQLAPVIAQHQLGGVVVEGHQQRTVHWVSRLYTRSGQDITQRSLKINQNGNRQRQKCIFVLVLDPSGTPCPLHCFKSMQSYKIFTGNFSVFLQTQKHSFVEVLFTDC